MAALVAIKWVGPVRIVRGLGQVVTGQIYNLPSDLAAVFVAAKFATRVRQGKQPDDVVSAGDTVHIAIKEG